MAVKERSRKKKNLLHFQSVGYPANLATLIGKPGGWSITFWKLYLMISTRDDDIPRHSSFNPSPAQSLHQQWNVPIASFFVTTVLREGVYLEKYSNMCVHGFHLLPVYFSLKFFFKKILIIWYIYINIVWKDEVGWYWKLITIKPNQSKHFQFR